VRCVAVAVASVLVLVLVLVLAVVGKRHADKADVAPLSLLLFARLPGAPLPTVHHCQAEQYQAVALLTSSPHPPLLP